MRSRLGLLAEHIAPATNDNVAMLVGAAGVGGSCVTLTQVEQYVRDGYVVVSGLLSPTVCSAAQVMSAPADRAALRFASAAAFLSCSSFNAAW